MDNDKFYETLCKSIAYTGMSRQQLVDEIEVCEREVARRDYMILWLWDNAMIHRTHSRECGCEKCRWLNEIEPIVGFIPSVAKGKVVPITKRRKK